MNKEAKNQRKIGEIQMVRIGWSKMTFEFVAIEPQGRQIRKISQGFWDAPCVKLNEK